MGNTERHARAAPSDRTTDADLLRQLLAQQRGLHAALDSDLRVVWLSEAFALQFGLPAADCTGRNWFDLYPAAGSLAAEYARALGGETVHLPLVPLLRGDQPRMLSVTLSPWQTPAGETACAALHVVEIDATATVNAAAEQVPELREQFAARRLALIRAISRNGSDGLCAIDAQARVLHISPQIEKLCGISAARAARQSALELVHPDDLMVLRQRFSNGLVREGLERIARLRFRVRNAADQWRWIDCLAVNALSDPAVQCILLYLHDATQEVAFEEQLRRRERRFAALTEKMEDLVVVFDAQGRASFASASVGRILGYRPRELRMREVLRRIHPAHRPRAKSLLRWIGRSRSDDERVELMIREASNTYRWLEVAAVDLRDDPDVGGVLVNARDVTARKMAELERDAALDGASVFVWEQDLATGGVRWLNRPDEPVAIGLLADAHDDDSWYAAVHDDDVARVRASYREFTRSSQPKFEIGYRVRARDGGYRQVLDRCHLSPFQSDGPHRLLRGVTIDVTEQRQMEDDLARSRERFQLAIECAAIDYYEWFRDGDIVIGSDRILGSIKDRNAAGQVRGASILAAMHPEDRQDWHAARRRHVAGEVEFAESRFRVRDSAGRWRWVFDRAQIVDRGPDNEPRRMVGILMDIDHTQRAELALGETEARLGTAVWAAHLGLWELDVGAQRAHWFSNWCELEDIDPCEGPDHVALWDANVHPEDVGTAAAQFSSLLTSDNDVYEAEYRVRTRSGEWRWIQERSRAVRRDAAGRPLRVVGTCINIHARKVAEQAVRDSQLRLQSIAINSSDWLLLLDTHLSIVFVNRAIGDREPEQLVGRSVLDIAQARFIGEVRAFYERVLTSNGPCEMREVIDRVDGEPRHMLVRAQAVRRGAQVVGIAVTTTELTTIVRQQQLLELQGMILDTMSEGVVLITPDDRIRLTNPAFDRLFGAAAGGLVDTPIGDLLDATAIEILRGATRSAAPREFECRRRDGTTFAAACVVTPIVIDGRQHLLAVLNDISERRVLEREILEVSNREQHRIGNDLHDGLGQELTGVALLLRALSTDLRRTQPQAMPEFDDIVDLLNRSIHNTRTLARGLSPVSLERGGLLPALRTLVARAREVYGVTISMRTRIAVPLRLDEAASNHLYRIVQEAISNAMRHGKPSRIVVQLGVDLHTVRLSIHDNGRGLPPTGPADTGLGLRTMRYRAHVTGGDVTIENHRHGGTIVRCTMPHVMREPQSLEAAQLRAHQRAHTRRGDPW